MFFISILLLTVLAIAGSAAFFSVFGLAAIFSGSFIPVIIMASSLEVGKLVAASFLYRYWKALSFLMRTYLFGAILILMFITSIGIFGFLSAAYQQDVLPLDEMQTQIQIYEDRKQEITRLKLELNTELERMDAQVAEIPPTHSTNRRKMRAAQEADRLRVRTEITKLSDEYQQATTEQGTLRKTVVTQEVHTGPIIFIARALGRGIDDAVTWMIVLIIFAFDPLAVVLTVGANIAILKRRGEYENELPPLGQYPSGVYEFGELPGDPVPVVQPEINYDEIAKRIHVPPAAEIDYDEIAKRVQVTEQVVDIDIAELAKQVAALVPDREHHTLRETIREVPRAVKKQTRDVTIPGRTIED